MKHRTMRLIVTICLMALLVALTASARSTALVSAVSAKDSLALVPTESPPLPERFGRSGTVDVGGHSLAFECFGDRDPTVIIEPNIGEVGIGGSWSALVERIQQQARVCVYDRANLGHSETVSERRTSQDIADDLYALLVAAEIPGPYVLVGHSYGGWSMRLFAAQHPDEVRALLLIDGKHPSEFAAYGSLFAEPAIDAAEGVYLMWAEMVAPDRLSHNPEQFAYAESAEQVASVEYLGVLPLTVLGHDSVTMDFPKSVGTASALKSTCQTLQMQLADLSWVGTYHTVVGATARIHEEKPDVVYDALMVLLDRARREYDR